jgi:predicted Zn-dependent protease
MLVSEEKAISASKIAYTDMITPLEKKGKIDNDASMTKRVNRITDELIIQAKIMRPATRQWEWSVKVIDDPETVNAWCMAGGKMAIYSGLITQLDATDDEIAQVMGHEISHALANHTAERMSVAMATSIGILAIAIGSKENTGAKVAGAAAAAKLAIELPNSRTSESEADRIGIELAAKAGYDPAAAVTLWEKMAKLGGKSPVFLSTHPAPENRQETLKALIPEMTPYYLAAKKKNKS